ncbi:hypothetical protein [Kitasatospora sp. NPDC085879]|uniref:hypothetical protein n=1 Tax=Kitasatospora sp. NPDC085879 TaxID=3154769 RepID=UPI0034221BDF
MSEPVGPADPGTESGKEPAAGSPAGRRTAAGRWVRGRWVGGRTVRWVAVGAAVVVLGGAAAAAVHHAEEHHGMRVAARDGLPGGIGAPRLRDGRGEGGERHVEVGRPADGGRVVDGGRDGDGGRATGGAAIPRLAPAPLPELAAGDAVAKAAAAVPGGKVEALRPADRQGGGRSWQAVVIGTDGVRHLVTVDGTTGAVTGNTVLDGSVG